MLHRLYRLDLLKATNICDRSASIDHICSTFLLCVQTFGWCFFSSFPQLQQQLIFEHSEVVFPGFKLMRSKGFGLEAGWRKYEEPAVRFFFLRACNLLKLSFWRISVDIS